MSGGTASPGHPQLKHFRNDKLPDILFLDTSILVHGLFRFPDNIYKHQCAEMLLNRIRADKKTAVVSLQAITEFWNVSMVTEVRKSVPTGDVHREIKQKPELLQLHLPEINAHLTRLNELIAWFGGYWLQVKITDEIVILAQELQRQYYLDIGDAIHVGTVLNGHLTDVAFIDRDFLKVTISKLNFWCRYDQGGYPGYRPVRLKGEIGATAA